MIIQSLIALYDRLKKNPEIQLSGFGYAIQKISFAIVLDLDGHVVQIKDLRIDDGGKLRAETMLLPSIERSGSGFSPQFMWDNTQYVFGAVLWDENDVAKSEKQKERAVAAFKEFKSYHVKRLSETYSRESQAVLNFLKLWKPEYAQKLDNWKDIAGTNLVFMIDGQRKYVHELMDIKRMWTHILSETEEPKKGQCLLTGKKMSLARLHPMIKNVDGAQAKGAAIASFNKNAFCSYGKEQSYNAPLNINDAFKYTAALNHILRRDLSNRQRIKVGDTTVVFWTERESCFESYLGCIFDPHDDVDDSEQLRLFLDAARKGMCPDIPNFNGDVLFYILGLAPNNSRLAVRFWYVSTVNVVINRIGKHFDHLQMERSRDKDPLNPGIWHLLKETARETKNISPLLGGLLMRSILEGTHYPANLFNGVLNRIRADQKITYLRAVICKAVLVRNYKMEVPMSLDIEKKDIAYLLGRLFAVLEKAQEDALGGHINSTIKDRFYGSASSIPESIFPRLLKLSQHHISKSKYGYVSDKRIAEIMEDIKVFPKHMDMKDQGLFAIAYYQQRNAFYRKNKNENEKEARL